LIDKARHCQKNKSNKLMAAALLLPGRGRFNACQSSHEESGLKFLA